MVLRNYLFPSENVVLTTCTMVRNYRGKREDFIKGVCTRCGREIGHEHYRHYDADECEMYEYLCNVRW